MPDIRDHGGPFGGGELSVNRPLTINKYSFKDVVDTQFKVNTTYNTDNMTSFAYNPNTNELFCLSYRTNTVVVRDRDTGALKRTLVLPNYQTDPNFPIQTPYDVFISDTNRLYICGTGTNATHTTVAEIDVNTGASIRYANGTASNGGMDSSWQFFLIDNEIWISSWTAQYDVFNLDLVLQRTYAYADSVQNVRYGNDVDKANNRLLYCQTSNSIVDIKNLSTGTTICSYTGANNDNRGVLLPNLFAITIGNSVRLIDYTGAQVATTVMYKEDGITSVAYLGNILKLTDDLLLIGYYANNVAGYAVYSISSREQVFAVTLEDGSGSSNYYTYTSKSILTDTDKVATQFPDWYGSFNVYQKIIKN